MSPETEAKLLSLVEAQSVAIASLAASVEDLKRHRPDAVLTAEEAARELRCSVDHFRKYYVREKKLLAPLPRKSGGNAPGKRGGRLLFLADEVAKIKGVRSAY